MNDEEYEAAITAARADEMERCIDLLYTAPGADHCGCGRDMNAIEKAIRAGLDSRQTTHCCYEYECGFLLAPDDKHCDCLTGWSAFGTCREKEKEK